LLSQLGLIAKCHIVDFWKRSELFSLMTLGLEL